jgi:hypothetical protein
MQIRWFLSIQTLSRLLLSQHSNFSIVQSDSLDNEGHQTYVELRKLASAMSIWRTTLAVSGHLSLAWLTRNR